jgi:hypothetical protein
MGARGHDFTVTQVTGAVLFTRHDARAQTTPNGERAMFTPSDFMFTPSDFAKIARAPAVVLTISFVGILLAYLSAASAFA